MRFERTTLLVFAWCALLSTAVAQQVRHSPHLTITSAPGAHPHAPLHGARGTAPPNDECTGASIVTLPAGGSAMITGDNTGSTDTEDFGNPNCWEAFSIDTCSTVTVSYCGTSPVFGLVYSILLIGCPQPDVSVQNNGTSDCGDGNTVITFENLAAGTYYIPVLLWPGQSEGPYTIALNSTPCALPPGNDRCINAIPLQVVEDCATGTVAGDNSLASQQGAGPSCASTASQFQDVWYTFNSGLNDQVVVTIGVGSIGDLGVEVRNACGGSVVLCGTGDTSYTVNVLHNVDYKVRVFSNNDFGVGGTFTICASVPPPIAQCDGGHVSLVNGDTTTTICNNEPSFDIFVTTSATVNYTLFLTDAEDTILEVLPGTTFDPSGLLPGTYRIWGVSHLSILLNAVAGMPMDSVRSIGVCAERSHDFLEIIKDVCQGAGASMVEPASNWSCVNGHFQLIWLDDPGVVEAAAYDMMGRRVAGVRRWIGARQRLDLQPDLGLAPGLYLVVATSSSEQVVRKVLVR